MHLIWIVAPMMHLALTPSAPVDSPHLPGCAPGRAGADARRLEGPRGSFGGRRDRRSRTTGAASSTRRCALTRRRRRRRCARRLDAPGIAYRPHFLVNMIEVDGDARSRPSCRSAPRSRRSPPTARRPLSRPQPATRQIAPRLASRTSSSRTSTKVRAPELWDRGVRGAGDRRRRRGHGLPVGAPGASTAATAASGRLRTTTPGTTRSTTPRPATRAARTLRRPATTTATAPGTAGLAVGDAGPGNRIGVAPRRDPHRLPQHGPRHRHARALHRMLRVVPRADRLPAARTPGRISAPDVINNSWGCPASEGCTDPNVLRDGRRERARRGNRGRRSRPGNEGSDSRACPTASR